MPPRSNQRVQQQFYNQSLRAFVQLLSPGSILSTIKFFPLTSKPSENRIHAHIKEDYKLFLPSGAFRKKSRALLVLGHYTNTDKPVGQRHCSKRAVNLRGKAPISSPDLHEMPLYTSARHTRRIPAKSHPAEVWFTEQQFSQMAEKQPMKQTSRQVRLF